MLLSLAVDFLGFHGDVAELALVSRLCSRDSPVGVRAFVETGTYYSATLQYMLRTFPHLAAYRTAELLPERHAASRAASASVSASPALPVACTGYSRARARCPGSA